MDSFSWKKLDDPSWVKLQHDYKVSGKSILALEEQRQVSGYSVLSVIVVGVIQE